jgi:hypothetical protein
MPGPLFYGNSFSRGMQNHGGGSFDGSAQQDIMDGDAFQGGITALSGTADVINPHIAGNYVIDSGSADAITIGLPTAEVDDGLSIAIYSDSAFAHTVTLPSAQFKVGYVAPKTVATFTAFAGAGLTLRAMDGGWEVVATSPSNLTTLSVTFT